MVTTLHIRKQMAHPTSGVMEHQSVYSPHRADFTFSALPPRTNFKPTAVFFAQDHWDRHRGLRIAQMSWQFSWSRRWADCPLNVATESVCPHSWKIAEGGLCKIGAVWTVFSFIFITHEIFIHCGINRCMLVK